jgi:hypothetical protein
MTLALPLSLGIRLLILCMYVAGFILTARLVRDLFQQQRPSLANAVIFLRSKLWQVLFFSGAFFASFILAIIPFAALFNLSALEFLRSHFSFQVLIGIAFFLVCICTAWILIPQSFRLIADRPSEFITSEEKARGRIAAIIVATICIVLYYFISTATPSINFAFQAELWLRNLVIWPVISILCNLPLALLWVFLAQLAYEGLQLPDIPSPS